MRFPKLIRCIYGANYITQLRKWYTISRWNKLLQDTPENALVIDFGAGEAQYLVPFCIKYPGKTFYATDNRITSIQFCQALGYQNLKTELLDIEKQPASIKADIGLCVGVMQYLENDRHALMNISQSLKPGARLLLYVPINGVIYSKAYQWVFSKYEQYESVNKRRRIYTEDEIVTKLNEANLNIIEKEYTYGFWGKWSHELLNTCSTLIFSAGIPMKVLAFIMLVILFPFIIIMMVLDYKSKKTDGNGLLLALTKN